MELATGTKYRFRFMNITPAVANRRVSLRQAGVPVEWRAVAKDAVDLPASEATLRRADLQISVGETYDFEFDATDPVELTLEGLQVELPGARGATVAPECRRECAQKCSQLSLTVAGAG